MSFAKKFEDTFRYLLPAPFTIAVILTLITMVLALLFGDFQQSNGNTKIVALFQAWESGLWNVPLLVFAVQMMLILVLGHALALSPPVSRLINLIISLCKTPALAAFWVTLFTLLTAFFNWGLGLIFGAILARKTGEKFARENKPLNYALIGAAGYSGLMVWHGGISGSAPIKVVEKGHLQSLAEGVNRTAQLNLPEFIPFEDTIFSTMNLTSALILLFILPLLMAWLGQSINSKSSLPVVLSAYSDDFDQPHPGAERLDYSRLFSLFFALLVLGYSLYIPFSQTSFSFSFISPNYLNLLLFGLALLLHKNFHSFLKAIDQAIGGAAGILIQFPLYFGIMGIMKSSGLITDISTFFASYANETTFPILTFMSAGLVNIFVPSGGGQWSIQGPIIVEATRELGIDLPKSIMAMAYGDQLTNMLQPFWALPLLGITGLKARDILPYTLVLLLAGSLIFIAILLIF